MGSNALTKMTLYINSGICKCGHPMDDHHLGMIMNNRATIAAKLFFEKNFPDKVIEGVNGYPLYIPQECDRYGYNEYGGMKYNEETDMMEDHCNQYQDKDGPLGEVWY